MYAAWLDLWTSRDERARPRREQLEEQIRARNPADYADKMDMFRAGRRDALGPEYQAAADEADLCAAQLSVMNDVLEWLEARKAMSERVTLDQVNRRALETARAKAIYVNAFMALLLAQAPMARGAQTGAGRASRMIVEGGTARAGETAKPSLPDSYWINKKAPTQVTPGTRTVNIDKPSSSGGTYHSTTHYDAYGRQIGQTHRTSHGRPHDHPNPHHHRRDPVTGEKLKDGRTGSRTWPGLYGN